MIRKRALLTFLFLTVIGILAFVPKNEDPLERLVSALQKWGEINPQEKVYLHMDKPYYALGDTIWFKAYVVTGFQHQLSALSGALYVDLITEKDSVVKRLKLPVSAGMSMGDITLADDLTEGNYRIRAYTQWMRNAGEDYFFDRTFTVGTPVSNEVIVKSAYKYTTVDGKQVLNALLNYTNEEGKALSQREVQYDIVVDQQRVSSKSMKTDAEGYITIAILNEKQNDLRGAYIRTIIESDAKRKVVKDFPIKAGMTQTDIQFFPESGNMVNGILSKVAFKATGIDGLGLSVKGKVLDSENKEIVDIETLHAGMGSFLLNPEQGKSYIARMTLPDGSEKSVPLPQAKDDGYVLSIYQPNRDSVLVRVSTAPSLLKAADGAGINLNIIVQSGGETIIASPIKIYRQLSSFWLQKSAFPSGIVQFTLFSTMGEPLNERLAFIKTQDRMQLKVSSVKNTYNSKERPELELESKDRNDKMVAGNFSVTVVDESKVPIDEDKEHTIFSDLLLTSDLKGYVEKPNYYFSRESEEVNKALDNLMLTQGYRRFSWKALAANPNTAYLTDPMFKKESLGTDISGVVKTLNDKLVPNAKITLVSTKIGVFETATADANGRFSFDGLVLTDSIKFTVQARTEKNGSKVEVVLDSVPAILVNKNKNLGDVNTSIPYTMKAYIDNTKKLDDFYEKTGQLNRVQKLREVNISGRKKAIQTHATQGQVQIPEGHSDQTYVIPKPELCATLGICLQGQLGAIQFKVFDCSPTIKILNFPIYRNQIMATILDGRWVRDCQELQGIYDNNVIDPMDIVKVEVVRTNIPLMQVVDGTPTPTLYIYTNRGLPRKQFIPSIANISPKGFDKAREFYTPLYDRPGVENELPDYRSTIYWNANLKTYSSGKTSFGYFNADGPGKYKVVVEGINAEGELGRAVYRYTVDDNGAPATIPTPITTEANILTRALDTLNRIQAIEKVYLHTDRPYYLVGDTIWFKAYLTSGGSNLPSNRSGTLYVDLIDEADSLIQTKKLAITSGSANAEFVLDDSTTLEGNYRIRAYTQWMRNAGPNYFYDRTFSIGNAPVNTVFSNISYRRNNIESPDKTSVLLKYWNNDGPLALRDFNYQIRESYKTFDTRSARTNEKGEVLITLPNNLDQKTPNPYLRTQLYINSQQIPKIYSLKTSNAAADLQFFPEGGALVNDIESKVAFKAIGMDGLGIAVTGAIFDGNGKVVTQIRTKHLGMGVFMLTPKEGQSYTANIKFDNGMERKIDLPKASNSGYTLAVVSKGKDSIQITVKAAKNTFSPNQKIKLLGQSNQMIRFVKDLIVSELTSSTSIGIKNIPSGSLQVTLFSSDFKPLNERLVFLQNSDTLSINLYGNKKVYAKPEHIEFQLDSKGNGSNGLASNLSVAVVSETSVSPNADKENSIFAQLLLSADLKGYIEKPNYYFQRVTDSTKSHLDLLMLTQGYRRFLWKDILTGKFSPAAFKVEKVANTISGNLKTLGNKPLANGAVTLFNNKNGSIETSVTDDEGKFSFENIKFLKDAKYTVQGRSQSGGKNVNISLDEIQPQAITPNTNVGDISTDINRLPTQGLDSTNSLKPNLELSKKVTRGNQLREVQIKAVKKWGYGNEINESQADQVFRPDLRRPCATLMECLIEMDKNSSVSFRQELDTSEKACGMLNIFMDKQGGEYAVLIDNMLVERCDYQDLLLGEPMAIDRILFSNQSAAITARLLTGYITKSSNGKPRSALAIYTKNGNFRSRYNPSLVEYRPKAYDIAKEFYVPKFNAVKAENTPGIRSTIYWNPNLITSGNGRLMISFPTNERSGTYRVTIEGIGKNGFLGRKVFRYEVANHL
jgi:hypothetical protein